MGNYFQGTVIFKLKSNLGNEIESFLKWLSSGMEESNLSDFPSFKDHEYFKKKHYDYPRFEYGVVILVEGDEWLFPYDDEIKEYGFNQSDITGKYLKISVCMKGYDNHIESFMKLIRPYIDNRAANYVGEIHDEDGLYNKRFYVDEKKLVEEIKNREYLCADCEYNSPLTLCDYYTICKRAYNMGRKDVS